MRVFIKSIYAGICIGLGGVVCLSCDNKTVGAFLFSIGLIAVLTFGFNLYTGKVCDIAWLKKPVELLYILAGNVIGAEIIAAFSFANSSLVDKVQRIVAVKMTKSPLLILVDGIICGICIAIAVKGYLKTADFGKYLLVVLGVMCFILCGAEHVVADVFYFSLAHLSFWKSLMFLIITLAGNTIGGASMILNDEVSANAILKRATKHYTVVIQPRN